LNTINLVISNWFNKTLIYTANRIWKYRFQLLVNKYGKAKNIPNSELVALSGGFRMNDLTFKVIKVYELTRSITALLEMQEDHSASLAKLKDLADSEIKDPKSLNGLLNKLDTFSSGKDVYMWMIENGDFTEQRALYYATLEENKITWLSIMETPIK
jgi:hypothetical protein